MACVRYLIACLKDQHGESVIWFVGLALATSWPKCVAWDTRLLMVAAQVHCGVRHP